MTLEEYRAKVKAAKSLTEPTLYLPLFSCKFYICVTAAAKSPPVTHERVSAPTHLPGSW